MAQGIRVSSDMTIVLRQTKTQNLTVFIQEVEYFERVKVLILGVDEFMNDVLAFDFFSTNAF